VPLAAQMRQTRVTVTATVANWQAKKRTLTSSRFASGGGRRGGPGRRREVADLGDWMMNRIWRASVRGTEARAASRLEEEVLPARPRWSCRPASCTTSVRICAVHKADRGQQGELRIPHCSTSPSGSPTTHHIMALPPPHSSATEAKKRRPTCLRGPVEGRPDDEEQQPPLRHLSRSSPSPLSLRGRQAPGWSRGRRLSSPRRRRHGRNPARRCRPSWPPSPVRAAEERQIITSRLPLLTATSFSFSPAMSEERLVCLQEIPCRRRSLRR